MALDPSEIFQVPSEALPIDRTQILSTDTLLILRPGVVPFKIAASDTGIMTKLTIGEPSGIVMEGDKKIIDDTEYTFLNGQWVSLFSSVLFRSYTAADKATSTDILKPGEPAFISDDYYLIVGDGVTMVKDLLSIFARCLAVVPPNAIFAEDGESPIVSEDNLFVVAQP